MPQLTFTAIIFVLSVAGFTATLIQSPGWGTSLFFLLLVIGSGYYGFRLRQKVLQRQEIYQHGTPVSAQVQRQARAFNPIKSSRDYVVWLSLPDPQAAALKLTSPRAELWEAAPQGATLTGLVYEGNYLFAEALRRRFQVIEPESTP